MLTPEEIEAIWSNALATAKDFLKDGQIVPKIDPNSLAPIRPEMWTGYNFSCHHHERMLPHIEPGEFAEGLFRHRAPNQTEEEFQYVRNNYKQTTLPVFNDLDNSVGRAMSPGNWSIDYMETAPEFQAYVTRGLREWGGVEAFITNALRRPKVADPMGLITIAPTQLDIIEDEDGDKFVDPNSQIKPDIIYTPCEDVWGFEYDRWYLIRLPESSTLAGKEKGIICWFIDDTNIYRIEQYGKLRDWTFTTTIEFEHGQAQPPCIHMMGVPSVRRGRLLWMSPFAPAVEHLDIVLSNTQYLQVSVVKFMYPQPVMVGDACEYVDKAHNAMCLNGWITWTEESGPVTVKCSSCNGTGRKSRLGPFNELVVIPDGGIDNKGNGINANNALAYVSPPTDSSRFVAERIDYHMLQARKVIHLDAEAPMAGGDAKTATEAGIGRKAQQAFVKPIVLQEFKIYDFILEMMAGYFGLTKDKAYILNPPVSFDIRTPEEMLAELTEAITSGLPPAIIDYISWKFTGAKFSGDESAMDAFDAIAKADRFVSQPWELVTSEAAAGRAAPWEVLLHHGALYVYELLASEDETFMTLDADAKALKMQEKAKELAASSIPENNALAKLAQLTKVA